MDDESSSPNLEWKKSSFEAKDKLTRKTKISEALAYEAKDKKGVQKAFSPTPSELPKGLKKIRNKIKDIYDEEDEEEGGFVFVPASMELESGNSSLLNALSDNEKRQLKESETINHIHMQQTAGKMEAIATADKIAKDFGFKGLSKADVSKNIQSIATDTDTLNNTLKDKLAPKLKGKWRNMSEAEMVNWLRGVKRIQGMKLGGEKEKDRAKVLEGWSFQEIRAAGNKKTDDQQLAEKILEKSGRKEKNEKKAALKTKSNTKVRSNVQGRG